MNLLYMLYNFPNDTLIQLMPLSPSLYSQFIVINHQNHFLMLYSFLLILLIIILIPHFSIRVHPFFVISFVYNFLLTSHLFDFHSANIIIFIPHLNDSSENALILLDHFPLITKLVQQISPLCLRKARLSKSTQKTLIFIVCPY